MAVECKSKDGFVSDEQAREAIGEFFSQNNYAGKRILLIIPDNTRSGPVGDIFKIIYDFLAGKAKGHRYSCCARDPSAPYRRANLHPARHHEAAERRRKYAQVRFFNHKWESPETFTSIGRIRADEIEKITGGLFREEVNVAIK